MLSRELIKSGHNILYVVFNKSAELEAKEKFQNSSQIEISTMHSAALRYQKTDFEIHPQGIVIQTNFISTVLEDEEVLKKEIFDQYKEDIECWINNNRKCSLKAEDSLKLVEQVVFWIFKSLEFWIRSSDQTLLTDHYRMSNDFYTYYPCKLNHESVMNFRYGLFYVQKAGEIWFLLLQCILIYIGIKCGQGIIFFRLLMMLISKKHSFVIVRYRNSQLSFSMKVKTLQHVS